MDLALLAQLRQEHAQWAQPNSSVAHANHALKHFRSQLSSIDGAPLTQGYNITAHELIPQWHPAQKGQIGEWNPAEQRIWDWRRFLAALSVDNYDTLTGGVGVLQFGLRPVAGTIDPLPNTRGPIWNFYMVLDDDEQTTVHFHPGSKENKIKRWDFRSDQARAAAQAELSVDPKSRISASLRALYQSMPARKKKYPRQVHEESEELQARLYGGGSRLRRRCQPVLPRGSRQCLRWRTP